MFFEITIMRGFCLNSRMEDTSEAGTRDSPECFMRKEAVKFANKDRTEDGSLIPIETYTGHLRRVLFRRGQSKREEGKIESLFISRLFCYSTKIENTSVENPPLY
jgi:hypothetical protein